MKKYLSLILLLISTWAYANDGRLACIQLTMLVENKTKDTCYLISQHFLSGAWAKQDHISYKIPSGSTNSFLFLQDNNAGLDVTLTYQCGAGEVSFESRKRPCLSGGAIDGTLIAASNMDATFIAKEGNFLRWIRGIVHWTLTN